MTNVAADSQRTGPARLEGVLTPTALFVLTAVTRLPFTARYLYHWDSVQYALALDRFDVLHHQPHPPGYLFYVMLGRAFRLVFSESNAALVGLSVVSSAGAVVMVYLLARRLSEPRGALLASLFFISSPLFWFYGEVALTYAIEAFLSAALVYLLLKVQRDSVMSVVWCALVLAVAGGVRQTTAVLLLPLFVYVLWRQVGMQRTALALAIFGAASLTWVAPTLANAGSLGAYLGAARNLQIASSTQTSVFTGGMPALIASLGHFLASLWYALELALFPLVLLLLRRYRMKGLPAEVSGWFVWLWVGPAVATFTLLHQGQFGYTLFLLVPASVYLPAMLTAFGADLRLRMEHDGLLKGGMTGATRALPIAMGALVAWNVLNFILVPAPVSVRELHQSDATLDAMVALKSEFTPQGTIIVTGPDSNDAFRHAGYYLPEYEVYAVVADTEKMYGWFFRANNRQPSYSLLREDLVYKPEIPLRPTTTDILIIDEDLERFAAGKVDRTIPLGADRVAYALRVYGGKALIVNGDQIRTRG